MTESFIGRSGPLCVYVRGDRVVLRTISGDLLVAEDDVRVLVSLLADASKLAGRRVERRDRRAA